jgi:hypothetical protein
VAGWAAPYPLHRQRRHPHLPHPHNQLRRHPHQPVPIAPSSLYHPPLYPSIPLLQRQIPLHKASSPPPAQKDHPSPHTESGSVIPPSPRKRKGPTLHPLAQASIPPSSISPTSKSLRSSETQKRTPPLTKLFPSYLCPDENAYKNPTKTLVLSAFCRRYVANAKCVHPNLPSL